MSEASKHLEMEPADPASILPVAPDALTAIAQALAATGFQRTLIAQRGVRTFGCFFSDAAAELSALLATLSVDSAGGLSRQAGPGANASVFDRGQRVRLRITGEDRVRWLNGMVTNTVKALAAGSHNYTFVLNAQGRIQGDATIFASADHLILETDRAQAQRLFDHLDRFIIMDDVELAWDEQQTTFGLAGAGVAAVLASLGLPTPGAGSFVTAGGVTVVAEEAAGDIGSVSGGSYSVWLSDSQALSTWQRLLAAGCHAVGAEAVEAWRVLRGVPLYGVDISDKTLAQETGQMRALNFNKGCYLGQEIVERVRSRANVHKGLRQFALRGEQAAPGAVLSVDGTAAGELTSVTGVTLPSFLAADGIQVGLGVVRIEAVERVGPTQGELRYPGGTAAVLAASPLATHLTLALTRA